MKYTVREVLDIHAGLQGVSEKEMDAAVGYRVALALLSTQDHARAYEQQRNVLVAKYGIPDDEGRMTVARGSAEMLAFIEEQEEMLDVEVELELDTFRLEDMPESIAPKYLAMLMPVLKAPRERPSRKKR